MHTFKTLPALALALALTAHAEDPTATATPPFINRLIAEAIRTHPTMEAAKARTEAAVAAVGAVRLWEDPQLGLGTLFASQVNRQGNGDMSVGIDQMLPRRGLYQAEKRRAIAEQLSQQARRQQIANELALSVAQAVLELALADEVVRLHDENVGWLRTMVTTAEERAKSPDATAAETLRLESELALRTQTLEAARRQRSQFAVTLNLLLGRPAMREWSMLALPQAVKEIPNATALKGRLEQGNPQLASMRHQVEGTRAETDVAREKRKPVFSVGVQVDGYSQGNSGDVMTMLTLKMSLPWFNRSGYKADLARAENLRSAAENDLAAEQRMLYAKVISLMTEAENNRRLAAAYTSEVLPKSEKTVEILQNSWVSSKSTLLEVLEARRTLLEARQEQKRALAAHHVATQALSALTGSLVTISKK